MARKTIHFSDLTSQPILDDSDVVRVVVLDHPLLGGDAVEFEAAVGELTDLDRAALDVVVVELHPRGDEPPRRLVLDVAMFDKLAVDQPMAEVLENATSIRPTGRGDRLPAGRAADRVNYATLEYAGAPHKGKMTDAEARLVRENLDIVNARLAGAGHRTIDPADPRMRERYGFGTTEDPVDNAKTTDRKDNATTTDREDNAKAADRVDGAKTADRVDGAKAAGRVDGARTADRVDGAKAAGTVEGAEAAKATATPPR